MSLTRTACLALSLLAATFPSAGRAFAHQTPAPATCAVIVHIDGFRNQKGDAGLSVFNSADGWPEDNSKAVTHGPHAFTGSATTITLQLPPGRYAFAALHDENSNHKL